MLSVFNADTQRSVPNHDSNCSDYTAGYKIRTHRPRSGFLLCALYRFEFVSKKVHYIPHFYDTFSYRAGIHVFILA